MFYNTNIKAVIFDCDGTLVDSEGAHILSWQRALGSRGFTMTLEDYQQFYVGKGSAEILRLLSTKIGCDCTDIWKEKRVYYREFCERGLPPIEATVQFAKSLAREKKRLGLKLGVASAAIKEEVLFHLKHLEIEELFDVVLSGQEDLRDYSDPEGVNKPKPYIYLHAAKLLGVAPAECVVIEDSLIGVTASKSAGCITIAVPNRFTEKQDLSIATRRLETLSGFTPDHFLKIVISKKSF